MKIDLYTNSFLRTESFLKLFDRIIEEGKKQGVEITKRKNTDLLAATDDLPFPFEKNAIFWDKDIYLGKYLEKKGVRLFNSIEAIETCDDKGLTHLALSGILPMPSTYFAPKTYPAFTELDYSFIDEKLDILGLPVIIKQNFGSFGNEVYLCRSVEEVHAIIKKLGAKPFLIQKFIESSVGRDVRVYVVGGKAVGAIKRESDCDFRANVARGGKATAFDLPDDFREIAETAAKTLGLDFCGVDILFGEQSPLLCEVNSNAHFSGFECATGVNVAEKIVLHVKSKIEENDRLL